MNDKDHRDPSDQLKALKKLTDHLSALDSGSGIEPTMESDMLSLIISGILNGEDTTRLYPDFHQKLLENSELRQAFLDALESVEAERAGKLIPMPGAEKTKLSFLEEPSPVPKLEFFDGQSWRARWQKTLEQLQAIFSPSEMAYRADPGLFEDPWFTLLREEMKVGDNIYDVLLDCTLSDEDSLSTILHLAVTFGSTLDSAQFPLRADLEWGDYHESMLLTDEGRVKFPDIRLASVFDQAGAQLKAGFSLTLETT